VKVLVVAIERQAREAVAALLREAGFDTAEARDGATALAALGEHRPNVLVCDWILPELFSREVVQRIRDEPEYADFSNLPIVILVDLPDDHVARQFRRVGADALVVKSRNDQAMRRDLLGGIRTAVELRHRAPVPTGGWERG